jgi:hypothetical protein
MTVNTIRRQCLLDQPGRTIFEQSSLLLRAE